MRVVAGTARGRTLRAPPGTGTRPTADRVREAMFSMLSSLTLLEGAWVVDLFAGSGALGIEALSRGAGRVSFVERDRTAVRVIQANLDGLGFAGDRFQVVATDALAWSQHQGGGPSADVVLADPPFAYDRWPQLLVALQGWTRLAVLQTGADLVLPPAWSTVRRRRYGASVVTVARPEGPPPDAREPKGEK